MCVALVIQSVKRMRRIMLSSGACPAVAKFSALPFNRHDFRGKKLLNVERVLFSHNFETFLILRRIDRNVTVNVHRSSRKVPVILIRF